MLNKFFFIIYIYWMFIGCENNRIVSDKILNISINTVLKDSLEINYYLNLSGMTNIPFGDQIAKNAKGSILSLKIKANKNGFTFIETRRRNILFCESINKYKNGKLNQELKGDYFERYYQLIDSLGKDFYFPYFDSEFDSLTFKLTSFNSSINRIETTEYIINVKDMTVH